MKIIIYLALTSAILISSDYLAAQTRSELEKQKYQNLKEIELASQLLKETQTNTAVSLNKLLMLGEKIRIRKNIIKNISSEIEVLNNEIEEKERLVQDMDNDLAQSKSEYAKLIRYQYYSRSTSSRLMYLLASRSFNQLYKRFKYLQQISQFRKHQAQLILEFNEEMKLRLADLEKAKVEKEGIVNSKKVETGNLAKEEKQQNNDLSNLKKRERELRKQIGEKRRIAEQLEKEIRKIIENEAKKRNTKNIVNVLTPEEKLLAINFRENRGKLPWPTERGMILNSFGEHKHPVLKDVTTRNYGIDISTTKGSTVRCIFNGEVSKVIAIPGTNYTVIVRHGSFITVYQNLVEVSVKNGDKLKTKDVIGKTFDGNDEDFAVVHLEIWDELVRKDPAEWLAGK